MSQITAVNAETGNQVTQFVYGSTLVESSIASSLLLHAQIPPNPVDNNDRVSFQYNRQGEVTAQTDQAGTTHAYDRDLLGRVTEDRITALATGVDNTVLRLETAYEVRGLVQRITSYDNATVGSGSVINEVQRVYNSFSQLSQEYQSHAGAVNTGSTPQVRYAYADGSANHVRLTALTYPNNRVLNYNYGSTGGTGDAASRLASLIDNDGTTHLADYTYLGVATEVEASFAQPGLKRTLIGTAGGNDPDTGDIYLGLDRFGRIKDLMWYLTGSGVSTDRFQYGHDRNGNRLYRDNLVNAAFGELYHAAGAGNGYDPLNQLLAFSRGTLNATKDGLTGTASRSQSWCLDATGNFNQVVSDGVVQGRSQDARNRITSLSGLTTPGYARNGNMTTDQAGNTLVYDAWNRLMQVKQGTTTLTSHSYDAGGRRILENPGTQRDLYYSEDWQVLEERVGGQAQVQQVWAPSYVDALLERDRDPTGGGTLSERLYAQQDANWNVTALVDTSGNVVERYVYDPYGVVTFLAASWGSQSGSGVAWVYGFQGQRTEPSTGLNYVRYRDYDPALMRWAEPDPIGYADGPDLYVALGDNPVGRNDPLGLQAKKILSEVVDIRKWFKDLVDKYVKPDWSVTANFEVPIVEFGGGWLYFGVGGGGRGFWCCNKKNEKQPWGQITFRVKLGWREGLKFETKNGKPVWKKDKPAPKREVKPEVKPGDLKPCPKAGWTGKLVITFEAKATFVLGGTAKLFVVIPFDNPWKGSQIYTKFKLATGFQGKVDAHGEVPVTYSTPLTKK